MRSEATLMAAISGRGTIEESGALYRLARPVLERYVRHLVESDTVDHEGTILKAWRYLLDGAVTPPWKAILVARVPGREPGPGRLRACPGRTQGAGTGEHPGTADRGRRRLAGDLQLPRRRRRADPAVQRSGWRTRRGDRAD